MFTFELRNHFYSDMKIIIVGTAYPYRGGLANYNERLARQFSNEGHDVEIWTFTLQYPSFLFPGKTQYSNSPAPSDLRITRCVHSCNPLNWLKVGHQLRRMAPDLLIIKFWLPFMAPCFGTIARIARKNGKTRVISILDNIIPHEKRIGDHAFAKYFVGAVDGFVAMSESVLNDVRTFDDRKPKAFCPHPLYDNFGATLSREEALTRLGLDTSYRYLLFFGLIRDYKGLDLLLDALALSRDKLGKTKLIVAGEFYNNGDQYAQQCERLNLQDLIVWHTEFVPDEEVCNYFCAADLIVQPYKSATQSGVTQIAYHFERPMLVTDVGGLAEIVPDGRCGYVVSPNAESIATALTSFCTTDNTQTFQQGLQEEKKKYAWDKMTEAILGL